MAVAQEAGEPHREAGSAAGGSLAVQPVHCAELSAQGRLPVLLGLPLALLGRVLPRPMVHAHDAIEDRADEARRPLILNWFRAKGQLSSSMVEGFNAKAKLTTRKAYGFWTYHGPEVCLYHTLGALPEPKFTHRFPEEGNIKTPPEILHPLIVLGLFVFAPTFASAAVPAFPGAQGGGAVSVGGRGGAVIEVTNLNDFGAGSLRACVLASGPRTCVFRVGGTINLLSMLRITTRYLTVAGQTAPSQNMVVIAINDVIFRYGTSSKRVQWRLRR